MHKTLSHWLQAGHDLQDLIGKQVVYTGKAYEIIDVLHEDRSLVLSSRDDEQVQEDSYGRAHRLVPNTEMVNFCDEDGLVSHVCQDIVFIPVENEG